MPYETSCSTTSGVKQVSIIERTVVASEANYLLLCHCMLQQ